MADDSDFMGWYPSSDSKTKTSTYDEDSENPELAAGREIKLRSWAMQYWRMIRSTESGDSAREGYSKKQSYLSGQEIECLLDGVFKFNAKQKASFLRNVRKRQEQHAREVWKRACSVAMVVPPNATNSTDTDPVPWDCSLNTIVIGAIRK
jgi:hypothetical protein